jgi:hypothetical protein
MGIRLFAGGAMSAPPSRRPGRLHWVVIMLAAAAAWGPFVLAALWVRGVL